MNQYSADQQTIRLFRSGGHPCAYLDSREAQTLFVNPDTVVDMNLYSRLIERGFRRSGEFIYRPDCSSCHECVPIRVSVNEFQPNRNQRRIWRKNQSLWVIREESTQGNPEHFSLFQRYINARHPDGEMAYASEREYHRFIASRWSNTRSFAFYHQEMLVAVAVTDILRQGLSAVYTFFDPQYQASSPGVFSLLWQITECRRRRLPWLYIGYWIAGCKKMAYKNRYLPHEAFINQRWVKVER